MKYVAFLRGINVGGSKVIKMDALQKIFTSFGLKNVKTYIASGNVLFDAAENSQNLVVKIEKGLEKSLGYEIKVLLRTMDEVKEIAKSNPFRNVKNDGAKLYVTFLSEKINKKIRLPFTDPKKEFGIILAGGREVFSIPFPLKNGKFGNPVIFIEKEFGKYSTTRNWNTVEKIASL